MSRTDYKDIIDKIETAANNFEGLTLTHSQTCQLMPMINTSTLRDEADNYDELLNEDTKSC